MKLEGRGRGLTKRGEKREEDQAKEGEAKGTRKESCFVVVK